MFKLELKTMFMNVLRSALLLLVVTATACASTTNDNETAAAGVAINNHLDGLEKAYFASGCFWCVEAIFESVTGVEEVVSGYSGGDQSTATYSMVSSERTKHAEAVEVYYNPDEVSYETLLKVFFGSHDPTTPNRQGPDAGPQYRSAIFYRNAEEKAAAEAYIKELEEARTFGSKIVTEVAAFDAFYAAEDYHQNYERLNPGNPYVQNVSIPRLRKFQAKFPELLKKGH